jgi:hypothetical protein
MAATPHAKLTPAMRKERIRQVANIMATLLEKTPNGIQLAAVGISFEISDRGRAVMADTLAAWLADEGL